MIPILSLNRVDKTASLQKQVEQMQSQIYQLKEQIEMLLTQVGTDTTKEIETAKTGLEDFVQSSVMQMDGYKSVIKQTASKLETEIQDAQDNASTALQTATSFSTRITDAEKNSSEAKQTATSVYTAVYDSQGNSRISQNASNINLKVDKGGCISDINLTSGAATISASKINLNGYTTINGDFSVDTSGNFSVTKGNSTVASGYSNNTSEYGLSVDNSTRAIYLTPSGLTVKKSDGTYGSLAKFGSYIDIGDTKRSVPVRIWSSARPVIWGEDGKSHEIAYKEEITSDGGSSSSGSDYPYGLEEQRTSTYGTYYAIDKTASGNANNIPTVEWVVNYLATH